MRLPRIVTLIVAMFLAAAHTTSFAETKIGYVDILKLMNEAPQTKAIQNKIESEFEPRSKKLIVLRKEMNALEERLNRDSAIMSEDEASKLKRDLLSKQRDLKRAGDEFQDDLNMRQNEILSKFQKEVYNAINSLAKEQKYDLILGQGVIFSSDAIDVTSQVMQKLK
ncbi:MAG: OmpH family outer membrane protein [Gammaproteobacteria bacterium]